MKSNFFWNFTPCNFVNVMFFVRQFAFVVKTKLLFVSLMFLLLELKKTSCQTFFIMFDLFSTKPESEFCSPKVFFMFCFCITLILGILNCYAQYDLYGFFSC